VAIEGLSIRLFLDHHMDAKLANDLRRDGFDVMFPREIGTERASDEAHLIWASERGRVVVTFDRRDFPAITKEWKNQGRAHAGMIICIARPPISYGELLRRLRAFLDAVTAEEMVNQVRWLDDSWSTKG
jgi:predicted nuclease of predicted toxin-antitoxin system